MNAAPCEQVEQLQAQQIGTLLVHVLLVLLQHVALFIKLKDTLVLVDVGRIASRAFPMVRVEVQRVSFACIVTRRVAVVDEEISLAQVARHA
eukprot:CAMPEP_0176325902 /NCGR_PEP_ID=MMETSP0121_2-20121125/73652_1 /TAXON_ID=160619 /ORGANISM="Kryptoperidinium foliaceum, Strain CCMP 1326" /LENGTH=91 /DNA_ID=CAMNT_0017668487 /DNA_START=129 /DNA_END=401 /DNA_ORIENTATION=+